MENNDKSEAEHFFDVRAPFHWGKPDVLKIMEEYRAASPPYAVSPICQACGHPRRLHEQEPPYAFHPYCDGFSYSYIPNVRSPKDSAIEHGGYLATAVEEYFKAKNIYDEAEASDKEPDPSELTDFVRAVQSAVYEFRKRTVKFNQRKPA